MEFEGAGAIESSFDGLFGSGDGVVGMELDLDWIPKEEPAWDSFAGQEEQHVTVEGETMLGGGVAGGAVDELEKFCAQVEGRCEGIAKQLQHEVHKAAYAQRGGGGGGQHVQEQVVQGHAQMLRGVRDKIEAQLRDAERLLGSVPLLAGALGALHDLTTALHTQLAQMQVLEEEWRCLHGGGQECPARLVVTRQDCCRPVRQSSTGPVCVALQVLSGVCSEVSPTSVAQMALDGQTPLEYAERPLDASGAAVFDQQIRFPAGTRGAPLALRCRVAVRWKCGARGGNAVLVSSPCRPLVVCTSPSQWSQAAGRLVAAECFAGVRAASALPWPAFCNILHLHYLELSRQPDPRRALRPLTPRDLAYLHATHFRSAPQITPQLFDAFWSWFGAVFSHLRQSRLLVSLWHQGLLAGFISKEGAQTLLEGRAPGTFLVRFSERTAGSFAVAYVKRSKGALVVKHYLVRPNDVAPPQRTLADFLGSQPYFTHVLQVVPTGRLNTVVWRLLAKDVALGPLYSKGEHIDGYDDQLPTGPTTAE